MNEKVSIKRPGNRLILLGGVMVVVGLFLAFLAMSSRIYEAGVGYHSGSPMGGLLILAVGVAMAIIGFSRRVLAALEK